MHARTIRMSLPLLPNSRTKNEKEKNKQTGFPRLRLRLLFFLLFRSAKWVIWASTVTIVLQSLACFVSRKCTPALPPLFFLLPSAVRTSSPFCTSDVASAPRLSHAHCLSNLLSTCPILPPAFFLSVSLSLTVPENQTKPMLSTFFPSRAYVTCV